MFCPLTRKECRKDCKLGIGGDCALNSLKDIADALMFSEYTEDTSNKDE